MVDPAGVCTVVQGVVEHSVACKTNEGMGNKENFCVGLYCP